VQVKAMKRRQIALALEAQHLAEKYLKKLLSSVDESKEPIRLEALSKILDTGCRLERLNRDEPEQNLELKEKQNFDNLSLEELETYRALLLKMGCAG